MLRLILLVTPYLYFIMIQQASTFRMMSSVFEKRLKSTRVSRRQVRRILKCSTTMPDLEYNSKFNIDEIEMVQLPNHQKDSHKFYGSAINSCPTLVLNADYKPLSNLPLSLWHWQDSIRAIFNNKAVVVAEYNIVIRSVSCEIRLPSVIALKHFQKNPIDNLNPSMTRKKVLLRDCYKCQYCLQQFPAEKLSLDHVVPRVRGGKLTWTNTVTACLDCNFKKAHYSLDELKGIGMRLKSLPRVPTHAELQSKAKRFHRGRYHPDWMAYI